MTTYIIQRKIDHKSLDCNNSSCRRLLAAEYISLSRRGWEDTWWGLSDEQRRCGVPAGHPMTRKEALIGLADARKQHGDTQTYRLVKIFDN